MTAPGPIIERAAAAAYLAWAKAKNGAWEETPESLRALWRESTAAALRELFAMLADQDIALGSLAKIAAGYEEDREYNAGLVDGRDDEIGRLETALRKVLEIVGIVVDFPIRPDARRR